jgi:hypothetical protein
MRRRSVMRDGGSGGVTDVTGAQLGMRLSAR